MATSENTNIYETALPKENFLAQETVFTIGNGYFSSRGSFEEGYPGEVATTFVHGVFNKVPVFNTELVNFPKWFSLGIKLGIDSFNLESGKILNYQRSLNMRNGLLSRHVTWESPLGHRLEIYFSRFMDMEMIHHAAVDFKIISINYSGTIQIKADIPGVVSNESYRHWNHLDQGRLEQSGCFLNLKTTDSGISAYIAQKVSISDSSESAWDYWDAQWMPTLVHESNLQPGDHISGTKQVIIATSRDVKDPFRFACDQLGQVVHSGFERRLSDSHKVWQILWERSDVIIEGDDLADRALRYSLFQILIAAPRHVDNVSIGAKTLSGYGYRGHVFWDTEIFILPFLIYTQPEIARNLLMYRYHTLAEARKKAAENGYHGALFAWESTDTGEEVTPVWVVGEKGNLIRIWCGDLEQHITADIAYAVVQYWHATGDDEFMQKFGAEMILNAAQFYASRVTRDEEERIYQIKNVIGPDEYHEHVDNNAFTNLMARWTLQSGNKIAQWFAGVDAEGYQSLVKQLDLGKDFQNLWREIAENITITQSDDGVFEQFDGYFDLEFIDMATLEPRHESLQSVFGIEGVQQYQFIKQPDVVMGLFLLRDQFNREIIEKNFAYYSPRTDLSYGSSLGPSVQSLMIARYGDADRAYEMFIKTLLTDLGDNRGNTTDGIHAASAGAVWQVILYGFLGFDGFDEKPHINPKLPTGWEKVTMNIIWHGEKYRLTN